MYIKKYIIKALDVLIDYARCIIAYLLRINSVQLNKDGHKNEVHLYSHLRQEIPATQIRECHTLHFYGIVYFEGTFCM